MNMDLLTEVILKKGWYAAEPFTVRHIRQCMRYGQDKTVGIEYGPEACNMKSISSHPVRPTQFRVNNGHYIYVIGLVNGVLSVYYKPFYHSNEIGSKHLCIIWQMQQSDITEDGCKIIIGGEFYAQHDQIEQINLFSGTISPDILARSQSDGGSISDWWIPFIQFIFPGAKFLHRPMLPDSSNDLQHLWDEFDIKDVSLTEFASLNLCTTWKNDNDITASWMERPFTPFNEHTMECHVGTVLLNHFENVYDHTIRHENGSITIQLNSRTAITVLPNVRAIAGQSVILDNLLDSDGSMIASVLKIAVNGPQILSLSNEYRILMDLGHDAKEQDCLVKPLCPLQLPPIGQPNTFAFMVLPRYNLGSLGEYLHLHSNANRSKLISVVAREILSTLALIHRTGYIHLDISPANILIHINENQSLTIGLSDLGMARKQSEFDDNPWLRTQIDKLIASSGCGTPYESADIENKIVPSPISDLESFGYVLFEVLYDKDLPWKNISTRDALVEKKIFKAGRLLDTYFRQLQTWKKNNDRPHEYSTLINLFNDIF